jgi:hypothetical protein
MYRVPDSLMNRAVSNSSPGRGEQVEEARLTDMGERGTRKESNTAA